MIETRNLSGAALDWAVATCEGHKVEMWHTYRYLGLPHQEITERGVTIGERDEFGQTGYEPSSNWAHGGPIIERERIGLTPMPDGTWCAQGKNLRPHFHNPAPLIAAMRCYVASKLGDEVNVPEELIE